MTSRPSRRTKRGLCSLAESQKRHSKLNQLADVVNDPKRMGAVNPALAAAMLTHGKGIDAAFKYRPWWGNEKGKESRQCNSWLSAGWEVGKVDLKAKMVLFRKTQTP